MSGGHYDYKSLQPSWLADELDRDIERLSTDTTDSYGDVRKAEPAHILNAMRYCAAELRRVGELARTIEWYLSGDYGDKVVANELRRAKRKEKK